MDSSGSLARHCANALVAVCCVMLAAGIARRVSRGLEGCRGRIVKPRIAAAAGVAPDCATILRIDGELELARIDTAPVNGCPPGNGFIVMHFARGKWRVLDQASEPFSCALGDIPIKVGRDIHVCNPPKTFVLCRVVGFGREATPTPKSRSCSARRSRASGNLFRI